MFANGIARLQAQDLGGAPDELALSWYTRYVHWFFRSWESAGLRETKPRVDPQLLHTVALTYLVETAYITLTFGSLRRARSGRPGRRSPARASRPRPAPDQ